MWRREGVEEGKVEEGVEEGGCGGVRVWKREGVEGGGCGGGRVWRKEWMMGVMKHIQLMYSSTDIHLTPSHPHTLT